MSNLAAAPLDLAEPISAVCCYKDKLIVSHGQHLSVYSTSFTPTPPLFSLSLRTPPLHMRMLAKRDCVLMTDKTGVSLWKWRDSGKLEEVDRVDCMESSTRQLAVAVDESRAVTGTSTGLVEVWSLDKDKLIQESAYKTISDPISGVSLSMNHEEIAVTCVGEMPCCYILSRSTGQTLHTLYYSEHEGEPNFKFIGCFFARSADLLFTCQSLPHCPAYLTQWDVKQAYAPVSTHRLHDSPATAITMSPMGFTLAVGTESGGLLTVNSRTLGIESTEELLGSPVTALDFSQDGRVIAAGSEAGRAKFVHNQYVVGLFARAAKGWVLFLLLAWLYFYLSS